MLNLTVLYSAYQPGGCHPTLIPPVLHIVVHTLHYIIDVSGCFFYISTAGIHIQFSFMPSLITLAERRPRNSIIDTTFYSEFRHGLHYCLGLRIDRTRLPTAFYWCRPRHAIKLHDLRVTGTALGLSIAR